MDYSFIISLVFYVVVLIGVPSLAFYFYEKRRNRFYNGYKKRKRSDTSVYYYDYDGSDEE